MSTSNRAPNRTSSSSDIDVDVIREDLLDESSLSDLEATLGSSPSDVELDREISTYGLDSARTSGELNDAVLREYRTDVDTSDSEAPPEHARDQNDRRLGLCYLDDSFSSSKQLIQLLSSDVFNTFHATSTDAVLEDLRRNNRELLLVNQASSLAAEAYFDLIRQARAVAGESGRHLPIVVVTDDSSVANIKALYSVGVNKIVFKPCDATLGIELEKVVEEVRETPQLSPLPLRRSVCLIEDSFTLTRMMRAVVQDLGHEIAHFPDITTGLHAIRHSNFDLVIIGQDNSLDLQQAIAITKEIRQLGNYSPDKSSVYVVVQDYDEYAAKALDDAGVTDVIVRMTDDDLKQALGRLMNGSTEPRQRDVPHHKDSPSEVGNTAAASPSVLVNGTGEQARYDAASAYPVTRPDDASQTQLSPHTTRIWRDPSLKHERVGAKRFLVKKYVKVLGFLALVLLAVGAGISALQHQSHGLLVEVIEAKRAPIGVQKEYLGRVASKKEINLTTPIPGQLTAVLVDEGKAVEKDQPLATLDDREAKIQLNLAKEKVRAFDREIAFLKTSLARVKAATARGEVSRSMVESLQSELIAVQGRRQIASQELRVAELELEKLTIKAPFAGTITQSYAIEGLWAEPPGALFKIVDLTQRELVVRIDDPRDNTVTSGQTVKLTSPAFPNYNWTETVVRVADASNKADNAGARAASLTLGPDAPPLRFGQEIEARFGNMPADDVITVPVDAIAEIDGRTFVPIATDEQVKYVPVTVGYRNATEAEIAAGLREGELVIASKQALEEGQHVHTVLVEALP